MGIIVCGANGAGKTTLARALAERILWRFCDAEEYWFYNKGDYSRTRTREEALFLMQRDFEEDDRFVFSAVKGDYGDAILRHFLHIVLLEAPKELRMDRIRERSFRMFGSAYIETEKAFLEMVNSRTGQESRIWAQGTGLPIVELSGEAPVSENIEQILRQIDFSRFTRLR